MRNWLSERLLFSATVLLVGLVLLLAVLQVRWANEVMDAQFERMQDTVEAAAFNFSGALLEEVMRPFFSFQDRGPRGEWDVEDLARLHRQWQELSRAPDLIQAAFLMDPPDYSTTEKEDEEEVTLRRYDFRDRAVETVRLPEDLGVALEETRSRFSRRRRGRSGFPRLPLAGRYLVVPAGSPFGQRGRFRRDSPPFLVLELDREAMSDQLLPSLVRDYFPNQDELEVAIVGHDGMLLYSSPAGLHADYFLEHDFSLPLLDPTRQLTTRGKRDGLPGRGSGSFPPDDRPIGAPPRRGGRGPSPERAARVGEAPDDRADGWKLLVRHRSGSLTAAVVAVRNRNLALSFGVLALLGSSVLMLLHSSRRLVALSEQKMEFVAGVSHELRTPLAVIRSAGDNLSGGTVRDEARVREYGDLIAREGRRLSALVDQVLEFAGIQSGARSIVPKPTRLQELIDTALSDCAPLIREANMRVETHFDAPDTVSVDAEALRLAMVNLITNATKHAASGGWLGVRAELDERESSRELVLSVADRGPGIDKREMSRLFEPFVRGDDRRTRGSGLGLALVKRTIESMGGRVEVSSRPTEGAVFSLHLPLEPATVESASPPHA